MLKTKRTDIYKDYKDDVSRGQILSYANICYSYTQIYTMA